MCSWADVSIFWTFYFFSFPSSFHFYFSSSPGKVEEAKSREIFFFLTVVFIPRIGFSPLSYTKTLVVVIVIVVVFVVSEPRLFSQTDLVKMESNGSVSSTANLEKFLCERLVDQSQSISERFRALFSLRNLKGAGPRNALILASRDSSNLLAHEAAFALGQMQDAEAIPALESVLNDMSLHPIVRHEAAEALGAIGLAGNVDILKKSLSSDPAQEVRETCELALKRIEDLGNVDAEDQSTTTEKSPFMSVDPAGYW
ncbi:PREDICTED: deoxyhypusine hydroxylase-like isoform X1 [Camelina sativa]|uniref:Deoxyhypusine hydroxylase-like isoform X1 n=2 Tax=Camelina sativa TaxID=90675 RepID=A0ABM0UWK6_CAMSA|nr:PREDICTED: deoxyhypusine hydroxylase-like isoform X1 [Camelina sativa]